MILFTDYHQGESGSIRLLHDAVRHVIAGLLLGFLLTGNE